MEVKGFQWQLATTKCDPIWSFSQKASWNSSPFIKKIYVYAKKIQ